MIIGGKIPMDVSEILDTDELQQAFRYAYALNPDPSGEISYAIIVTASIKLKRYMETLCDTEKRLKEPGLVDRLKKHLPTECFFQKSLYEASQEWEKDQEGLKPRKNPRYIPTLQDKLVRYINFLIWEKIELINFSFLANRIGCHLYQYSNNEIEQICEPYIRSGTDDVNQRNLDNIKERFPTLKIKQGPNNKKKFEMRKLIINKVINEKQLVFDSLEAFTPSWTKHIAPPLSGAELFGFDKNSAINNTNHRQTRYETWQPHHFWLCTRCAGIEKLIEEWNKINKSGNGNIKNMLDDPNDKLEIPNFDVNSQFPTSPNDETHNRFKPDPLSSREINKLTQYIRNAFRKDDERRKKYIGEAFYIRANGNEEVWGFNPKAQENNSLTINISLDTRYVEICGKDEEGELLFAVFPLPSPESDESYEPLQFFVMEEGNKEFQITVLPIPRQNEKLMERTIEITYKVGIGTVTTAMKTATANVVNMEAGSKSNLITDSQSDKTKGYDDSTRKPFLRGSLAQAASLLLIGTSAGILLTSLYFQQPVNFKQWIINEDGTNINGIIAASIMAVAMAMASLLQAIKNKKHQARIIQSGRFWITTLFALLFFGVATWFALKPSLGEPKYSFENGISGWVVEDATKDWTSISQSNEQAKFGQYSMKMLVDVKSDSDGRNSSEAYIAIPTQNLEGKTISVWIYVPEAAIGQKDKPSGAQVYVKDSEDRREYSEWVNIKANIVNQWQQIKLIPSRIKPEHGDMNEGFNPNKISTVGIKFSLGSGSTASYAGPIYIDTVDWP